jgi:hypothetical protein
MSTSVAIRFDDEFLTDLRRFAERRGANLSAATQMLILETLRRERVPGIVFRDGPAGRRSAVEGGPDVWKIVDAVKGAGVGSEAERVAAATGLTARVIEIAPAYYSRYPDEIDAWITENEREAEEARAASLARQALA